MTNFAIHGTPRSGSTWLGEIINSSPQVKYAFQPLFSFAFRGFLGDSSGKGDIDDFFRELAQSTDPFILQTRYREEGIFPTFQKSKVTHVGYKEVRFHNLLWNLARKTSDLRFIFIVRNPLASLASWLKAPREFRSDLGWKAEEEWRYALKKNLNRPEEFNGFEKWKEATNLFLQLKERHPARVFMLSYSHLINDTTSSTKALFDFLELEITHQTSTFVDPPDDHPAASNPYGVFNRKQSDDSWKGILSESMVAEIYSDLEGTPLQQFLTS